MKVRKRVYPTGKVKWRLDLGMNDQGRRVLLSFDSEGAARAEMERRRKARARRGAAADWFSDAELLELRLAREALEAAGAGCSIGEAVRRYLATVAPVGGAGGAGAGCSMRELLERCLEAKWEAGKRPRYLSQLKCSALSFVRWPAGAGAGAGVCGDLGAHLVTRELVGAWLNGHGWAPKTRRVYLTDLRTVFAWGVEAGLVRGNPCEGIRPPALEVSEVSTLSVGSVARLLVRCARVPRRGGEDFGDLLPYVVLGIFAGLRPERELGELTWDRINLDEGTVIVSGRTAKSRGRRVVDLAPNACAMLRAWAAGRGLRKGSRGGAEDAEVGRKVEVSGKVVPVNFVRRWRRLRKGCGFGSVSRPWAHDVMRHSYASYHYAKHQNEHLLKAQMGHHQGSEMLFQHYRAVRSGREAERFWMLGTGLTGWEPGDLQDARGSGFLGTG